jgi:hypothetical protein
VQRHSCRWPDHGIEPAPIQGACEARQRLFGRLAHMGCIGVAADGLRRCGAADAMGHPRRQWHALRFAPGWATGDLRAEWRLQLLEDRELDLHGGHGGGACRGLESNGDRHRYGSGGMPHGVRDALSSVSRRASSRRAIRCRPRRRYGAGHSSAGSSVTTFWQLPVIVLRQPSRNPRGQRRGRAGRGFVTASLRTCAVSPLRSKSQKLHGSPVRPS